MVCILFPHFLMSKNVFSSVFSLIILAFCMVSIQERVMMARVQYTIFVTLLQEFKSKTMFLGKDFIPL